LRISRLIPNLSEEITSEEEEVLLEQIMAETFSSAEKQQKPLSTVIEEESVFERESNLTDMPHVNFSKASQKLSVANTTSNPNAAKNPSVVTGPNSSAL